MAWNSDPITHTCAEWSKELASKTIQTSTAVYNNAVESTKTPITQSIVLQCDYAQCLNSWAVSQGLLETSILSSLSLEYEFGSEL